MVSSELFSNKAEESLDRHYKANTDSFGSLVVTHCPRLFGAIAFILVMSLAACSDDSSGNAEPVQSIVRPAKLLTIENGAPRSDVVFPAVVQADEFANLNFQIGGKLRQLNVLEGEVVTQGEIIAALDPLNATNEVVRARAEYENAKSAYERGLSLVEENAIAVRTVEERQATMQVAKATLNIAEEQLRDSVLRAPYDGRVSRVYVRPFQVVQAGEDIVLLQSAALEAVFSLPSSLVAKIDDLTTVDATVRLNAAPDRLIGATFKEIAGTSDNATQTYEAAVRFVAPEGFRILPGMTAEVSLNLESPITQITAPVIPLSAVVADTDKTYVWQVDPYTNRLTAAHVKLGAPSAGQVQVLSGLHPGDVIVAAGAATFQDGAEVRPWAVQ